MPRNPDRLAFLLPALLVAVIWSACGCQGDPPLTLQRTLLPVGATIEARKTITLRLAGEGPAMEGDGVEHIDSLQETVAHYIQTVLEHEGERISRFSHQVLEERRRRVLNGREQIAPGAVSKDAPVTVDVKVKPDGAVELALAGDPQRPINDPGVVRVMTSMARTLNSGEAFMQQLIGKPLSAGTAVTLTPEQASQMMPEGGKVETASLRYDGRRCEAGREVAVFGIDMTMQGGDGTMRMDAACHGEYLVDIATGQWLRMTMTGEATTTIQADGKTATLKGTIGATGTQTVTVPGSSAAK